MMSLAVRVVDAVGLGRSRTELATEKETETGITAAVEAGAMLKIEVVASMIVALLGNEMSLVEGAVDHEVATAAAAAVLTVTMVVNVVVAATGHARSSGDGTAAHQSAALALAVVVQVRVNALCVLAHGISASVGTAIVVRVKGGSAAMFGELQARATWARARVKATVLCASCMS